MNLARRLTVLVALAALIAGAEALVDLNTASVNSLRATPGVGLSTAQRIVRIRERNGPYRCLEELRAVPRLTEAQFQALAERFRVDGVDCKSLEAQRRAGAPVRP